MTTILDKPLRRQIRVGPQDYTVVIDPLKLHLVAKGRRKGIDIAWEDMVTGEAALATALSASVAGIAPGTHAEQQVDHPRRQVRRAARRGSASRN